MPTARQAGVAGKVGGSSADLTASDPGLSPKRVPVEGGADHDA